MSPLKWGFRNYIPGVLHNPRPYVYRDFCRRNRGGERAAQMTAWWVIMFQGASPHQSTCPGTTTSLNTSGSCALPLLCWHLYRLTFLCLCRYYGLSVWFPDVIKHLQSDEYALLIRNVPREKYANFSINFTMQNQIHTGMEYYNGRSRNFEIILYATCSQKCISY